MKEKGKEHDFVYDGTDEMVMFTKWEEGQPNGERGIKANCVSMYLHKADNNRLEGYWNDVECDNTQYQTYACQLSGNIAQNAKLCLRLWMWA